MKQYLYNDLCKLITNEGTIYMEFRGETIHFTDDEQDLFGVPSELSADNAVEAIQHLDEEAARSNEHGLALQQSPYLGERAAGQRIRIRAGRVSGFAASMFELIYNQPDSNESTGL